MGGGEQRCRRRFRRRRCRCGQGAGLKTGPEKNGNKKNKKCFQEGNETLETKPDKKNLRELFPFPLFRLDPVFFLLRFPCRRGERPRRDVDVFSFFPLVFLCKTRGKKRGWIFRRLISSRYHCFFLFEAQFAKPPSRAVSLPFPGLDSTYVSSGTQIACRFALFGMRRHRQGA